MYKNLLFIFYFFSIILFSSSYLYKKIIHNKNIILNKNLKLFNNNELNIDKNFHDKDYYTNEIEHNNLNLNDNLLDDNIQESFLDHSNESNDLIQNLNDQLNFNLNNLSLHTNNSLTNFLLQDLKDPGIVMLPLFNYTDSMIQELTNNTVKLNETDSNYYTKYHLVSHVGKKDLKLIFSEYKNYLKKYSRPTKGFRPGSLSPDMLPYARIQVVIHALETTIKEICSRNNIIPCTKSFKPLITGEYKSTFEDLHFPEAYLKSILLNNRDGKGYNDQIKLWKEPKPLHFQAQFIGKKIIKNNKIDTKKDQIIHDDYQDKNEHVHTEHCKH